MDNGAIFGGEFTVIAVTPDVVELSEVSAMVFSTVLIAPKTNGHARERRLTDKLTLALGKGYTCLIPNSTAIPSARH